jgi:hypothetical protein
LSLNHITDENIKIRILFLKIIGQIVRSNNAVMATAQTNRGIRSGFIFLGFMLIVVEMKFTAPRIEDTPARCSEKIAKSTDCIFYLEPP